MINYASQLNQLNSQRMRCQFNSGVKFSKAASQIDQISSRRSHFSSGHNEYQTWDFLQARKQSQLNSKFQIRKTRLNLITEANYRIFEKINTQQSYYSIKNKQNKKSIQTQQQLVSEYETNKQTRKMLGPICNFDALRLPVHCSSSSSSRQQSSVHIGNKSIQQSSAILKTMRILQSNVDNHRCQLEEQHSNREFRINRSMKKRNSKLPGIPDLC